MVGRHHVGGRATCASSTHLHASNSRLWTLLPGNQPDQDALDWIKLGGVDEWVGGDVEKSSEHDDIVTVVDQCEVRVESRKEHCSTACMGVMDVGIESSCIV